MGLNPSELWNAWRTSRAIQEIAEGWMSSPDRDWTDDQERLAGLVHSDPDQALATIFAVMQMTDDQKILAGLAAGPLEDFLGVQGERYVDAIHTLALEHRRLREVLDGVWQGAMPNRVWHRIEILKQSAFS
jgi:hypothetical protein